MNENQEYQPITNETPNMVESNQEVAQKTIEAMQEQLEAATTQILELTKEVYELTEQAKKPSPEDQQIRRDVQKILEALNRAGVIDLNNQNFKHLPGLIGPRLI